MISDSCFRPSKSMGQNFITDGNIIRKIVKLSGINNKCGVLEVGPGFGALTRHLANTAGHITAIELDKRLADGLYELTVSYPNVRIIQGDILKVDIRRLVSDTLPENCRHVCANLPYNITTPVITRLIEADVFISMTLMVQKEVAQRICALPGSPDYGAFSVYANYHAMPEILFDVPPGCFSPRPKVTSSVVKLVMRDTKLLNSTQERVFFFIVRAAFNQRRKTLVNALYAAFGGTHNKEKITEIIQNSGLDAKIRGETLSYCDFIELSRFIDNNMII